MNKRKMSLLLNVVIVIFEIFALIITIKVNKRIAIEFYTEDSNLLALFSSGLFTLYLLLKKKIPYWLQMLKYITTINLTITFLIVILVLAPMYNFNYMYFLFYNSLIFQHFLCPIISVITFLMFDEMDSLNKKDNIWGLSLTIIYALILIILNLLNIVIGPYPFLMVKTQPVIVSLMWLIIILGLTYLIAYILLKIKVKERKSYGCRKNN